MSHEHAARFFAESLQATAGAKRAAISPTAACRWRSQNFGLGYAAGGRQAALPLAGPRIVDQMVEAGLVITGDDGAAPRDRFRDRRQLPFVTGRSRVIAFGGRALSPDLQPKATRIPPEMPLFHKGEVLYNLDKARKATHSLR